MRTPLLWLAVALVIVVGGFFLLNHAIYTKKQADTSSFTLGTYDYRCGDGTEFSVSFNNDISLLLLVPASNVERVGETIITRVESENGVRFEGDGLTFTGVGETATLTGEGFSLTCLPVTAPNEAPFNFGD